MPSKYLRDDDRIVRYVSFSKMRRDEDEVVLGVLGTAFGLRDEEKYLSVTWCEYFTGEDQPTLRCAIEAIRNSDYDVRPKGHFVVLPLKQLKVFMSDAGQKIRVIHHPEKDNDAHSGIHRWPGDDDDLLQHLADEQWIDWLNRDDADALPMSECEPSEYANQ